MFRTIVSPATPRGTFRLAAPIRSSIRTTNLPSRTIIQRNFANTSKSSAPSSRSSSFTFTPHFTPHVQPSTRSSILQRLRSQLRSFHKSRASKNGSGRGNGKAKEGAKAAEPEPEPTTLSGKLKRLSREYGWSALGVYLALSALDFPFCYLLVRYLGTDLIGEWEEAIVSNIKKFIPEAVKQFWHDWRTSMKKAEHDITGNEDVSGAVEMAGWGVEEATEKNKKDASLGTQLALAYAIHKSFIFVRVPLTAAVVPKVVKMLRGWGWDIGKRTTKEAKAIRRANMPLKKPKARWSGRKNGK